MRRTTPAEGILDLEAKLVLHSDNGATMKATTVLATLYRLGVKPSYPYLQVRDNNNYAEALIRIAKYRLAPPAAGFTDLHHARQWAASIVSWCNFGRLYGGIRTVRPARSHVGAAHAILPAGHKVHLRAAQRKPARRSRHTSYRKHTGAVTLPPEKNWVVSSAATPPETGLAVYLRRQLP